MHGTKQRQIAISKLIKTHKITSQAQLVALLEEEWGILSNQAVVSRDLKVMGVVRKVVKGERVYALAEQDVEKQILQLGVKDIQHNEAIIVITTEPGLAPYVGDAVDAADVPILGCLAGENMVFATPISTKKIKQAYQELCQALHFKERS